jgi:replicative DNA helicase
LTIDERVRAQVELENLHGMIDGYRTPWPELDAVTRGMHNGEIWVLIAAKKTGKTWGEILFMRELVKQNLRPLLVTMEMSSDKIIRRFDAMYSTLSFGDFRSGLLGFDGIQRYVDEMRSLAKEGEFFIAGDGLVRCPADIEILVQDLNPGAVLIDGIYLMEPSGRKWGSKYEKVSTVVDEIQPMVYRIKLPILMSTQFNRNLKEGALVGDSGKVGYAYEIVQNCDLCLAMYRDKDLRASNRMLWSILEHREGEEFTWLTRWDLDGMHFDFVQEVQLEELIEDQKKGKSSASKFKF